VIPGRVVFCVSRSRHSPESCCDRHASRPGLRIDGPRRTFSGLALSLLRRSPRRLTRTNQFNGSIPSVRVLALTILQQRRVRSTYARRHCQKQRSRTERVGESEGFRSFRGMIFPGGWEKNKTRMERWIVVVLFKI